MTRGFFVLSLMADQQRSLFGAIAESWYLTRNQTPLFLCVWCMMAYLFVVSLACGGVGGLFVIPWLALLTAAAYREAIHRETLCRETL